MEEIWKYTHIPVCIKSGEQETEEWVGISREEAEQECGKRMEYKLSEKNGVVMAVVPEGVNKESVEELLELLAKSYHMRTHTRETEEREVYLDEVKDFAECGLCGTAAVISPVGKIVDHGKEICFPSGMEEMGPVTKKLYETLTGIQMGHIEAPEGWICKIC